MSRFREFNNSIVEVCEKDDELSTVVKGRMSFVRRLHSEDAVYHNTCSQYFRLGKPLPKRFAASSSPASFQRKGRPINLN